MLTGEIVLMGDGSPSMSSTAVGVLLGGVALLGVMAYVGAKNSHRSGHRSGPPPWAKKGIFRGLGDAIQLWGPAKRRRRSRRR